MSTALDLPGRPYAVAVLNDETAFVSLRNDGEALAEGVAVVSLQENELRSVCGLAAPRGVAFTNDRRRLVVAQDHGALAILDVERLVAGEPECVVRQVATVANGSTGGVAVSLDGRYAFTAEERAFCISVIDIELACEGHLGALVGTIPAGFMPMSVLPSRDGRALYFSCQRTDPDHLFLVPAHGGAA